MVSMEMDSVGISYSAGPWACFHARHTEWKLPAAGLINSVCVAHRRHPVSGGTGRKLVGIRNTRLDSIGPGRGRQFQARCRARGWSRAITVGSMAAAVARCDMFVVDWLD